MDVKESGNENKCSCCGCGGCPWFAYSLIGIGVLFLASEMGWIPKEIPIWPVVVILFGVYLVFKNRM